MQRVRCVVDQRLVGQRHSQRGFTDPLGQPIDWFDVQSIVDR